MTISQGEAVNLSNFTTKKLNEMIKEFPKIFERLSEMMKKIEDHFKDMHYIEFTVENGELYLLQTRVGKRTAMACVKIAIDMMKEFNPEEGYFTHISHYLGKHDDVYSELPSNMHLAYDGLKIKI